MGDGLNAISGGLALNAVPAFLITLALIPVLGMAMVWIVREMILLNLGAVEGVCALCLLFALFVLSIVSRTPLVAGATMIGVLTLGAFYPYAESQMARQVGREINMRKIDRAHEALSARPDNVTAWFALAEGLYRHGFQGHAIALAESTLQRLSSNLVDPLNNRSVRDLFGSEERALKQWKRDADPSLCRPLKCPLCHTMNPPGGLACTKCGKPYLLELARKGDLRKKFVGKLVLGWAVLALCVAGAAFAGVTFTGYTQMGAIAGLIALVGGVLYWLFRPPKGDLTGAFEV